MSSNSDITTLVCLFHHESQAEAAVEDLERAGITRSSLIIMRGRSNQSANVATLQTMGVPQRDLQRLQDGVADGGILIALSAMPEQVVVVEQIFGQHKAGKIDETAPEQAASIAAPFGGGGEEVVIPVIEEALEVGKRTVDQGGVRVYRRVVEIPTEQTVKLREEHVTVERTAVDRPATQADLESQGIGTIELTETSEEPVIEKTAHVVEEVVIGKQTREHTQHIHDTVRRTEVEVENLDASGLPRSSK